MTRPNWPALRRCFRSCVIATIGVGLFLLAWQFLVPAGDSGGSADGIWADLGVWALLLLVWLCFGNSIVLAIAASRSLWRARRRAVCWTPAAFLLGAAVGLPILAYLAGVGPVAVVWSFPLALLLSGAVSICVILFTPAPGGEAAESTDALDEDPHAYARDIVAKRAVGKE